MPRGDPQAVRVGKRLRRRRPEHRPLFVQASDQPLGRGGDLVAAENAHQLIDARVHLQELVLLALGQATGDDHAAGAALLLEIEHLADYGVRFAAGIADEGAGIDDDKIAAFRFANHLVAVQAQQAGHAFAVNQVLGTAKGNECIGSFGHAAGQPGRSNSCDVIVSGMEFPQCRMGFSPSVSRI